MSYEWYDQNASSNRKCDWFPLEASVFLKGSLCQFVLLLIVVPKKFFDLVISVIVVGSFKFCTGANFQTVFVFFQLVPCMQFVLILLYTIVLCFTDIDNRLVNDLKCL